MNSIDPATGNTVWSGEKTSRAQLGEAVLCAKKAVWATLTLQERIGYLEAYAVRLQEKRDSLAETIAREVGKPLWEAHTEVEAMIQKIPASISAYEKRCAHDASVQHKPHGLVAVLGPFNFPGHLPNGHIVPALLAGNTVLFKPSEKAPLVGERLAELLELPEGVLQVVQGDAELGQMLATYPHIDGLFFTGSFQAGLKIHEAMAKTPQKILALEMGGNNPLVVHDVQDPEAVALLTIQSAFLTAGQRCSCARRLIVVGHQEPFIKVLVQMSRALQVGPYTDEPEPFMGPVIDETSAERLIAAQAYLGTAGGKSLLAMEQTSPCFLTPGIMDVTEVAKRKDEELFGPFLQLISVPTFDAAIEEANRTDYGLCASLVSQNESLFERFLQQVRAGVINFNSPTTGASSRLPFGGIGKSGNHRPSAAYAADYCAYPVASARQTKPVLPTKLPPGLSLLARS